MAAKKEIQKRKKGNRLGHSDLIFRINQAIASGQKTAKWCIHLQQRLTSGC